jgi:hypothetical protein
MVLFFEETYIKAALILKKDKNEINLSLKYLKIDTIE